MHMQMPLTEIICEFSQSVPALHCLLVLSVEMHLIALMIPCKLLALITEMPSWVLNEGMRAFCSKGSGSLVIAA